MFRTPSFFRALLGAALCLALGTGIALTSSTAAIAAGESQEAVQKKLDSFVQQYAASFNRCVVPSKAKMAVTKNPDGTFTATYREMDPKSFQTSFSTPKGANPPKGLQYIATIHYDEVDWRCTAPSKTDAVKGPFNASRQRTTEWIKYLNGKWTN